MPSKKTRKERAEYQNTERKWAKYISDNNEWKEVLELDKAGFIQNVDNPNGLFLNRNEARGFLKWGHTIREDNNKVVVKDRYELFLKLVSRSEFYPHVSDFLLSSNGVFNRVVDAQYQNGENILHSLARSGKTELLNLIVKQLLNSFETKNYGVQYWFEFFNKKNQAGQTPLDVA